MSLTENIAFRIEDTTGKPFILRLHRPEYHTLQELVSEYVWIDALRNVDVDVPVPLLTRDGTSHGAVMMGHEHRYASVLECVEGPTLGQVMQEIDDAALTLRCYFQLISILLTFQLPTESLH